MIVILGIDPGLVHSGLVMFCFSTVHYAFYVESRVVPGILDKKGKRQVDIEGIKEAAEELLKAIGQANFDRVFIEDYRPRSNFENDSRMSTAVSDLRKIPNAHVLSNTGTVKLVKPALMKLLGVWTFSTTTHHQDLRAAARIALLGMFKEPELNILIGNFVSDSLSGNPWRTL